MGIAYGCCPEKTFRVRVCVHMRNANKAIIREGHQMPSVEKLTSDLYGATIFSEINLT